MMMRVLLYIHKRMTISMQCYYIHVILAISIIMIKSIYFLNPYLGLPKNYIIRISGLDGKENTNMVI